MPREIPEAESAVAGPPSEARVGPLEDPSQSQGVFEEIVGEPEVVVPYSVSGAATIPKTSPSCVDLNRDNLPVFGAQPVPACS